MTTSEEVACTYVHAVFKLLTRTCLCASCLPPSSPFPPLSQREKPLTLTFSALNKRQSWLESSMSPTMDEINRDRKGHRRIFSNPGVLSPEFLTPLRRKWPSRTQQHAPSTPPRKEPSSPTSITSSSVLSRLGQGFLSSGKYLDRAKAYVKESARPNSARGGISRRVSVSNALSNEKLKNFFLERGVTLAVRGTSGLPTKDDKIMWTDWITPVIVKKVSRFYPC